MESKGGNEHGAPLIGLLIAREAMEIASEACNVTLDEMQAPDRKRAKVSFARQLAMYLCHVVGQMSLSDISSMFGRDRTTVAYACHIIEDRRDSPFFNAQLEYMETTMRERTIEALARARMRPIRRRDIRRIRKRLMR